MKRKYILTAIALLIVLSTTLVSCKWMENTRDVGENKALSSSSTSTRSEAGDASETGDETSSAEETTPVTTTTEATTENTSEEKSTDSQTQEETTTTTTSESSTTTALAETTTTGTSKNPQTIPGIHIVQEGDYPALIASLYNLTLEKLYEINQSNLSAIYVNQKIIVDPALAPSTTATTTLATTQATGAQIRTTTAANTTATQQAVQQTTAANTTSTTIAATTTTQATTAPTTQAVHSSKPTINQLLGVSREAFLAELINNQSLYLSTPIATGDFKLDSFWAESNTMNPGVSFNCIGFVASALRNAGGNLGVIRPNAPYRGGMVSNLENWHRFITWDGRAEVYVFKSIESLLASGLATKGDLIYSYPTLWPEGHDAHVGVFWGNTPNENLYWHSDRYGNRISNIRLGTSADNATLYLVKVR